MKKSRLCCKRKGSEAKVPEHEKYTIEEIEEIDNRLFTTLTKEKKARFNWRKVMIMI